MKVLSSKPETSAPAPLNQDNASTAPVSPTDFLFSLMLQASTEVLPQAEPSEMQSEPELNQGEKKESDQLNQFSEQMNASNNALLLEQLNMMRVMDNNQPLPQANAEMKPVAAATSTPSAKAEQPAQAAPLPQMKTAAAMLLNQQANTAASDKQQLASDPALPSTALNAAPVAADNKKLTDMRQLMTANDAATDKPDAKLMIEDQLKQISSDTIVSANEKDMDDKLAEKISKQKLAEQMPAPVANVAHKPHETMPRAAVIEQAPAAAFAAAAVQTQQQQQSTQQNKYADAFVQLGHFISEQAMHVARNNDQILPQNFKNESVSYFQGFNKTQQTEPESKIELFTASIDALNKETYDAKIKIHPPELGHVTASIKVDKNHAELVILTENNRVKEIVELNLPRLREHFQSADINLTNIQVHTSQSGAKEQNNQNPQNPEAFPVIENTNETNQQTLSPKEESSKTSDTIIDTYA